MAEVRSNECHSSWLGFYIRKLVVVNIRHIDLRMFRLFSLFSLSQVCIHTRTLEWQKLRLSAKEASALSAQNDVCLHSSDKEPYGVG